jgi:hypothetical protein
VSLKHTSATLYMIVFGLIMVFVFSPLILYAVTTGLGQLHGCAAYDDVAACTAPGLLSDGTYRGSAAEVFSLVTVPIGMTAIAVWLVVLIVHLIHAKLALRRPKQPAHH